MRIRQEECFLLRTIPYSESSLIVDIFSRKIGRFNVLAKGARRVKSRLRGKLRLFDALQISCSGKGNLPILTHVNVQSSYSSLVGETLYSGSYINELIVALLQPGDPHPDLFSEYSYAISCLQQRGDTFHTLRVFEKKLLKEIGYALVLETESDHKTPIREDQLYQYNFDSGPSITTNSERSDTVSGQALLAIATEYFGSAGIRREVRDFLDRALQNYLDGKKINSRHVFRQTIEWSRNN